MAYEVECQKCRATCWVRGTYEEDVNALTLRDIDPEDWNVDEGNDCEHEDFEVIDSEEDEPEGDY